MIATLIAAVVVTASIVQMIAFALPLVVDFVTRSGTSPRAKALLLGVLAAALELITGAVGVDGAAVLSTQQLVEFLMTWAAAGLAFALGWKPTGVSDRLQYGTPGFIGRKSDKIAARPISR